MRRPEKSEYAEYYEAYVGRVPDRPLLEVLAEAPDALEALLAGLSPEQEVFAYAPGKWTIRDVVGHVLDTERVFGYRALHVARGDPSALPGMDQDVWAIGSNAAERRLADQLAEFRSLRASHVSVFGSFDDEILTRVGVASGLQFSVRALVYVVTGHEIHHRGVLAGRYLPLLEGS
jgi:uncharacterized damage-inducible protein DinB